VAATSLTSTFLYLWLIIFKCVFVVRRALDLVIYHAHAVAVD
jgi:hypothetical protein